jgi:diguanylate cyclase (GGDEF)-like protein/PAS domain S-box-containing protein
MHDAKQHLAAIMDISREGILVLDSGNFTVCVANNRATELFRCSNLELIGKFFYELVSAHQTCGLKKALGELAAGSRHELQVTQHFYRKDKVDFRGDMVIRTLLDEAGQCQGLIVSIKDVTERLAAEEQIKRMEKNYWEIFNSTNDVLFVHDAYTGAIFEANKTVETLFGYSREEVFFKNLQDLSAGVPPYSLNEAIAHIRKAVEVGPQTYEWLSKKKDGELFWTETTMIASHIGGQGRVLAVVRDIGDRKEMERHLKYVSAHDFLTGLYNRMYFESEFKRLARENKYPLSIIVADLDGLKQVNDTLGHVAGDELIKSAASLLSHVVRGDDLVARLGGDEFILVLTETDEEATKVLMERIRTAERSMHVTAKLERVSFSLGSATARSAKEVEDLVSLADSRMYEDKAEHKRQKLQDKR